MAAPASPSTLEKARDSAITPVLPIADDADISDDPDVLVTTGMFLLTALAEILGCYLTELVVKHQRPLWLRLVDGAAFSGRDLLGAVVILGGMGILMGKSTP